MKKSYIYAGIVSMLLFTLLPLAVNAAEFRGAQEVSLNSGETINGNTYLGGGTVTDTGAVKGDLVIGGGTISVNGPVSADLLIGGGNITVTGDIGGDVRIGGGNIALSSKVAGDVVIGGGQIVLSSPQIGGDVMIAGGNIDISAPINGNLRIAGGQVTINGPVKGNVEIRAQKVTLGPKAVISGDLTYTAREAATMQSGASVQGKTDFTKQESSTSANVAPQAALAALFSFWLIAKLLMELLAAFLFMWIFPRYARELARNFGERPLENLGRGFVTFIVLPVGAIILLVTIIGIPLGFLALLSFAALMIFASLVTPVAMGALVYKWLWKPADYEVNWIAVLIGVAIYFLLSFIPFIGWIIKFIAVLMTLGVAVQIKWAAAKNWR